MQVKTILLFFCSFKNIILILQPLKMRVLEKQKF